MQKGCLRAMKIKLGRQRFWLDGWRFEIWPELLSQLPKNMKASTAKELADKYLDVEMDEEGRLGKNEELYGLFAGKEVKTDGSYMITGINFINNGELTDSALELVEAYQRSDKKRWMILLAEQILKYSPRVRAIIIPMLKSKLIFEKGWFIPLYNKTILKYQGEIFYPFSRKKEDKNLNSLLKIMGFKALGPWWLNDINSPVDGELNWRGLRTEEPSLSGIGQLRNPFELFRNLSWIDSDNSKGFYVNKEVLKKDINKELFSELTEEQTIEDELELLKQLIKKHQDFRGFFPIQKVGEELYKKLDINEEKGKWIESFFKTMLAENKIRIIEHRSGQPRHGKGLYGMRDYQLLNIEVLD